MASTGPPPALSVEGLGKIYAGGHQAAAAATAGVAAVRVRDEGALDAWVATAFLAHRRSAIGFLADAVTSRNAPYNLGRRIGSPAASDAAALGWDRVAAAVDVVCQHGSVPACEAVCIEPTEIRSHHPREVSAFSVMSRRRSGSPSRAFGPR